jgi:3-oxoacid CoA-transferase A subunit
MKDKIFSTPEEALFDVYDGATIMIGGFGGAGCPHNLVEGLAKRGVKNLTVICCSFVQLLAMTDGSQIRKVITPFPVTVWQSATFNPLQEGIDSGRIEVDVVPQGTMAERMRAAGAGIAGFYTPTGVGTVIESGKEKRVFDGREYILERGLRADFALIQAHKADELGNLVYRKTMRNFNPEMATAADVTIAEVSDIVKTGEIDPDNVHTSCLFVHRIVKVAARYLKQHRLIKRD